MFLFAAAVPALLVVVVGYVAGYAVAEWLCGLLGAEAVRTPEVAGWTTGLVLLAVVLRLAAGRWRRRRQESPGHRKEGHQK
jgi:biotin transporter BioY